MTSFTLVGNQRYDYDYDDNGNLTCMHDLITPESYEDYSSTLSYNLLNLPLHLTTDGDDYIDFRYLADGTKVSAIGYEDYGFKYAGPFRYRVELGYAFIESSEAAGGRIWCYDENDPDTPAPETRYFITDHLGSTRVVLKGDGTLSMKADYLPYGGLISGSGLNVAENDYLWTGKELQHQLFDTPAYDSSARLLFTNGLFASLDPLAEKYPGVSPYAYCAGNPVNLVDPEGKEIGDKETILFGLHHPIIALKVGKVSHNKTNISTNSTRFAATGEVLYGSRPKEQEERGSEAGAFRHTLWQATITSRYNAKIAKQIGDAHEIDPKNVDFNNLTYSSIDEADKSVDLMNNQIGRAIGESLDPSYGMLSIALKVLYYYNDNGLYTASQTSEGTWVINKTKLSDDKTKQLTLLFLNLDNNGFSISE